MQPRAPVSFLNFLGLREVPKIGIFPPYRQKSQTFYTINCFSDSPEGFALLLAQCAALRRQIAQIRTPF